MADPLSPVLAADGEAVCVIMPLRNEAPAQPRPEEEPSEPAEHPESPAEPPTDTPQSEPDTQTRKEPPDMAEPKKPDLTIHPAGNPDEDPPVDPLEELIARSQTAREQARELNTTLREIVSLAKAQRKQDKGIRTELRNAQGVLEKLRDIAA